MVGVTAIEPLTPTMSKVTTPEFVTYQGEDRIDLTFIVNNQIFFSEPLGSNTGDGTAAKSVFV